MRTPRPVDVARLVLGAGLVARPDLLLRWGGGGRSGVDVVVVRALGVRYVGQALGGAAARDRWTPSIDAAVDLVHAATMVALAVASPTYRRPASASAGVAVVLAAADLAGRHAST